MQKVKLKYKIYIMILCALMSGVISKSVAAFEYNAPNNNAHNNVIIYNDRMFNTTELQSKRLKAFSKWLEMLERYRKEHQYISKQQSFIQLEEDGQEDNFVRQNKSQKNDFITPNENGSLLKRLEEVNKIINERKYIIDPINWKMADYWATPDQFSIKDGDCEDYAISKYMLLKDMGFPKENMRIVVLSDENLRILHAVLAVYTEDGKIYILDNQISSVLEDKEIHHYKPIYSINELYWWKHR